MKKFLILALTALMISVQATAQGHLHSRYYNKNTGRLDYSKGCGRCIVEGKSYIGLRIGPGFSTVSSDDPNLDGGNSQTGLSVGVVAGIPLSDDLPLFLEPGLMYVEKGGKREDSYGEKVTYDLNYLQVPVVLKYAVDVADHITVQPFFGGYFAYGVGGKAKNFLRREAVDSFDKDRFKRFDAGLRMGCGVAYDLFYLDLSYDLGLANICHSNFDKSTNGCFALSFGVNF